MTVGRSSHSCCTLQSKLWVFGGFTENGTITNSIEVLDVPHRKPWNLFNVEPFSARFFAAVSPIVDGKILVMGGEGNAGLLSDCMLVDTESLTAELLNEYSEFDFTCFDKIAMDRFGSVVALVEDNNHDVHVVRYQLKKKKLESLFCSSRTKGVSCADFFAEIA